MLKSLMFLISFLLHLAFGHTIDQREKASIPKYKIEMKRDAEVLAKTIICYSCFAYNNDAPNQYNDCLNAIGFFETCPRRQCYTEFNPLYVKRGCFYFDNKTFYCNDLLCNDKPADEINLYGYETLGNWKQDNTNLQEQRSGYCKSCQTIRFGINKDSRCEIGRSADHERCRSNQVCFTNVDESTRYITRGCANAPVYNSIFFYCNQNACNNRSYSYYEHLQTLNIVEMFPTKKARKDMDLEDEDSLFMLKRRATTNTLLTKKKGERLGGNGYAKIVTSLIWCIIALTLNM